MSDISPDFNPADNYKDSRIIEYILQCAETPMAIVRFRFVCHDLTDYGYWFLLSTLWVSYSGWSDLNVWRRLFRSGRPRRISSIMKPSELTAFEQLPDTFTAYRSHRPHETDWISYTLDKELADRWTMERGGYTQAYSLKRNHCIALFLRRGELEIIVLDPKKVRKQLEAANNNYPTE